MKQLCLQALLGLALMPFAQSALGMEACANCYWPTTCGSISTQEVVKYKLVNKGPDVDPWNRGPFRRFVCSNGSKVLGVLWTNGDCGSIGGLSGLSLDQFPNPGKAECQYNK